MANKPEDTLTKILEMLEDLDGMASENQFRGIERELFVQVVEAGTKWFYLWERDGGDDY